MLPLIYQDRELLVLNKPNNVALLQDRSGAANLWDQLREAFGKLYLVHRLDKGTSGVLLVARNQGLQRNLTKAFNERRVRKFYCATVLGDPDLAGTGQIDLPLMRGRKSRYRVAAPREAIQRQANCWRVPASEIDKRGLASVTRLRVLASDGQRAPDQSANQQHRRELLLAPKTGRTHQLRVHLAWIGYPILGDTLYGKPKSPDQQHPRLRLHHHRLTLPGFGSFHAPRPW